MCRKLIVGTLSLITILAVACSSDPETVKRRLVDSGDKFVAQRNYPEAIIQYRNAVAKDANFAEARSKLAAAYEASGDLSNGLFHAVRAADQMPDNVEAQLRAGRLLLAAGQFPEAKARALAVLNKAHSNVEAMILLGNALVRMKDLEGAISEAEQAIQAEPQRTMSYNNLGVLELLHRDQEAAESTFKDAVQVAPKSAATHVALANYYWAVRRLVEAERELKIGLDLEPNNPSINRSLGAFYLTQGRPVDAEPYLKKYADLTQRVGAKLTLADLYLAIGKTNEAVSLLERLLQEKDGFGAAKLRLAAVEDAMGRRKSAYEALETILARDPKNEDARMMKAALLVKDHRSADALPLAQSVVDLDPRSARGEFLKGEVLASLGSSEEAIKAYQEVLRLNPGAVPAQIELSSLFLAQGDAATAVNYASEAIKAQPRSAAALTLLAKAELQLGHTEIAESELMSLVKSGPPSADAYAVLGRLYFTKHDFAKARDAYNRALKVQGDAFDASAGLVELDLAENQPAAARARIEAQLGANPDDPRVLLLAGTGFLLLGDQSRGESVLQHLVTVDPASLEGYHRLGVLYLTQNRLDDAKRDYEEAVAHQAKPVAASTMLGIILEMQNKRGEARKRYEATLALDPSAAVAANNLAMSYADSGDNLDVALQLAQTAKAQMPNRPEADDTLGWVYYKKGLAVLAITSFKQSIAMAPKNPGYLFHLGLAYVQNQDKVNARQTLQAALRLKPKFTGSDEARKLLKTLGG